jgi:hypothetical protein
VAPLLPASRLYHNVASGEPGTQSLCGRDMNNRQRIKMHEISMGLYKMRAAVRWYSDHGE